MSAKGARRFLAAAATCLLLGGSAGAGETLHEVRAGESASSIAKQYYGDFAHGERLLNYNGNSGSVIRVGETLRVPYCETHLVGPGDTWSELAQRYLGRSSAYPSIALLNGLAPDEPLRAGGRLVMPVVLTHPLARGETLAGLAERYYGDAEQTRILTSFNNIDDPRKLSVGQAIQVPLVSLKAKAAPRKPEPKPVEPEPVPEPEPRFGDELTIAAFAFDNGEYARARDLLESLAPAVDADGVDADRAELQRLLAFVYVAFDMPAEACEAYLALAAPARLDPDLVSPKIRETLAGCRPGESRSDS